MSPQRAISQRFLLLVSSVLILAACSAPRMPLKIGAPGAPSALDLEALLGSSQEGDGQTVVSLAQQQLGRPYRYGGVNPNGFDCSGLVFYVHRQLGLEVPRSSRHQFRAAQKVAVDDLLPGDLLFFNISGNTVSHVGIYVAGDLFIHSPSSGKGVSYASLAEEYWQETLAGAGRLY